MDHRSDSQQQPAATPVAGASEAPQGTPVSQRRRRFIQAGVVPVGLTLASRPAMAWHCNTTSAWGSAVLRNGGTSVKARADAAAIQSNECWTISNWVNNSVRSDVSSSRPWSFVVPACFGTVKFGKNDDKEAYARANLKVSQLFGTLSGVDGTTKIADLFKADATGATFATTMCVARLNALFAGHRVSECMLSTGKDMLLEMAKTGPGVFKPTNSTVAWSLTDIRTYLRSNYIVT